MDKKQRKRNFDSGDESIPQKVQKIDTEGKQKQNYCENQSTPQSELSEQRNLRSTTPVISGYSTNIDAAPKAKRSLFQYKISDDNKILVTKPNGSCTIPLSTRSPPKYRNYIQDLSTKELHDNPISMQRTTENQGLVFLKHSNVLKWMNTDSRKVTDTLKIPQRLDQVAVDLKTGNIIVSFQNSIRILNVENEVVTLKEICTASSEMSCIAIKGNQQIITGKHKMYYCKMQNICLF